MAPVRLYRNRPNPGAATREESKIGRNADSPRNSANVAIWVGVYAQLFHPIGGCEAAPHCLFHVWNTFQQPHVPQIPILGIITPQRLPPPRLSWIRHGLLPTTDYGSRLKKILISRPAIFEATDVRIPSSIRLNSRKPHDEFRETLRFNEFLR